MGYHVNGPEFESRISIEQDPRAPRSNLFSDWQNMYNREVLVGTVNKYIAARLGRRPILRYQVLLVHKKLYSLYLQSVDWFLSCREYCKQFEINTAKYLLSLVFFATHFKYRKQKHNLTYSPRLYFIYYIYGVILIYFVSCQTNRTG